jgi:hypothetical protein
MSDLRIPLAFDSIWRIVHAHEGRSAALYPHADKVPA